MTKYAYQKIDYRPTTKFRSGAGQQYLYNEEDSVLAWWSLSLGPKEGTPPTTSPDMPEQKFGKLLLSYDSAGDRSLIEETVPSVHIARNSSLFDQTDVGKVNDADGKFSFTDGTNDKPFSISFWIKPIGTTVDRTILAKWDESGSKEYLVKITSENRIHILLAHQASSLQKIEFTSNVAAPDNTWSHVVITYSAIPTPGSGNRITSNINVYINGSNAGQKSGFAGNLTTIGYTNMSSTSNQLGIGRDALAGTTGLHANLVDLVIFNKELSASSILALYNAKDGVWIRSRNFDEKGSKIEMPEGGSVDPFREGVSIRNGEDLSTSIRMKIHSGLNFVKAHSGSAITVDSPFDDSDIPVMIGDAGGSFKGVLDSSRGKSGYTSLLLHEIEKRDFGVFDRYQDGTPFNDSVFDSPQKILEDVRTTAGSPQDRHLRVYIGETPNELYNPTDLYDKEARIDVFERSLDYRTTIPDLRDPEKDFTRRSRRHVHSGSRTLPKRFRGFSGECNCVQIADHRYNDMRESSIPFYEFYNEGDVGTPLFKKQYVDFSYKTAFYADFVDENNYKSYISPELSNSVTGYWPLHEVDAETGNTKAEVGNVGVGLTDGFGKPSASNPVVWNTVLKRRLMDFHSARSTAGPGPNCFRVQDPNDLYRGDQAFSVSFITRFTAHFDGGFVAKGGMSINQKNWWIYKSGTRTYRFLISGNGGFGDIFRASGDLPDGASVDGENGGDFIGIEWDHIVDSGTPAGVPAAYWQALPNDHARLTVTYDGSGNRSGMKFYFQEFLLTQASSVAGSVATLAGSPAGGGFPLHIGTLGYADPVDRNSDGNPDFPNVGSKTGFTGQIGDLVIFNRAITGEEIKQLVNMAGSAGSIHGYQKITPKPSNENSLMHPGRGRIETVLSQSSGPRSDETTPKGNEPYGVYAQSTVNTFYGISGAQQLQGRTFKARYRVSSADRPFVDTSKEDLVPTLINTSNDSDFITEVKTLYMTGSSVHEGGDTGYSMSTSGFQGDLGKYNRDSLAFLGLKRGQ